MAGIARLRVQWAGSPVTGPSISTFYSNASGGVGLADAVLDFFDATKTLFPFNLQWTVPSNGDVIQDTTGDLTGTWSSPGEGGTVTTSGAANWTQGVGTRIVWNTAGLFHGRRVKGSTFLVPLWSGAYEGAGNITAATISTLQSAGNALIAAHPDLVVWSNPRGGSDGEVNVISSCTVPDAVSWLRSRRT